MISALQIAWAAGFLEGEGCFRMQRSRSSKTGRVTGHSIVILATQVQREPLARLAGLFGGSLHCQEHRPNPNWQPLWRWVLTGHRAAGLMFSMYSLLSPRRKEQVLAAIDVWKTRRLAPALRRTCPKGHDYAAHLQKDGRRRRRRCLACRRKGAAPPRLTCPQGHDYATHGVVTEYDHRRCLICRRARGRAATARWRRTSSDSSGGQSC